MWKLEFSQRWWWRHQHSGIRKFHLRIGHEGQAEQRYSSTLSLTSALHGDGWLKPRRGRFTPGKNPVPIVQVAGWAPGPVWTGAENLDPTGIPSPDRPVRSVCWYTAQRISVYRYQCFKVPCCFHHQGSSRNAYMHHSQNTVNVLICTLLFTCNTLTL
jgi:hypothetical protein